MTDEIEKSDNSNNSNNFNNKDKTDVSLLDDPRVLESLKQMSLSEHTAAAVTETLTQEKIKNIVEAALLAAGKTISLDKILTLFPAAEMIDKNVLRQAIDQLMLDYQSRGVELVEVSSGFRFQVCQTAAPWVSRLWEEKPQKYSRALLETLALIAYRQPITRGEIEAIRGVSVSSQIIRTLVDREWVRIIGHRDVPGRPAMYASTKQFLDYFSLKRLDELPSLDEIRDLDVINAELDFGDAFNKTDNAAEDEAVKEIDTSEALTIPPPEEENEAIDIDAELQALSETYKKLDDMDKQ